MIRQMRPRVIVALLLKGSGFVKTKSFDSPTYIGDALNTLKIFNDKGADEIMVLDIEASKKGTGPQIDLIAQFAQELFIPLGYGGGISSLDQVNRLISDGVEKVSLNSCNATGLDLITDVANRFGSQAVVGVVDHKSGGWFSRARATWQSGCKSFDATPVQHAQAMVDAGAGEILVQSVDRDGQKSGYDLDMVGAIADAVNVPVIAAGGAGNIQDISKAIAAGAAAAAAGSLFVFHGKLDGILINYPDDLTLDKIFSN